MRLLAAVNVKLGPTRDRYNDTSHVQWRELIAEQPRRYGNCCHLLTYSRNGHGHNASSLENAE